VTGQLRVDDPPSDGRADARGERDPERGARAKERERDRPDQIVVFLDRQRPDVRDEPCPFDVEVGGVREGVDPIVQGHVRHTERAQGGHHAEIAEEGGQDAEGSPHIERPDRHAAPAIARLAGVPPSLVEQ